MGASLIFGIDGDATRLRMAQRMGADIVLDYREVDVVSEIKRLTGGGVDVAIEALGTQTTLKLPSGYYGQAGHCRVSASILASCRSHMTPLQRALGIIVS